MSIVRHNGDVPAPPPTDVPARHVLWLVVAFAVALGPGVAAILTPFEVWPWTNAPMFAHSPVDGTRLAIDFTVVDDAGRRRVLEARRATGLPLWQLHRAFLVIAWGSDDRSTPFGHVVDDTPALRAARVERFFAGIVAWNAKRPKRDPGLVDAAFIEVGLTPKHRPGPRRLLGRYDVRTQRFVLGDAP